MSYASPHSETFTQPVSNTEPELQTQLERDMVDTLGPFLFRGKAWILFFTLLLGWGAMAYVYQLKTGLAATGMTNRFSWGIYIINFVFFIGISHAGTLVSAILRVTGTEWRTPITRMAEGITTFALLVGAPMVIIDLGRLDRIANVFIHGRLQSPILWDTMAVITYLAGSLIYLYFPMIPDMAFLRDHGHLFKPWRRWLYGKLALGWTGTDMQKQRLERGLSAMAIVIIPVAISVHTVVSYIFSMTMRPGWHSSIFGPYFVVGAIYSGIAALLTAIIFFRWFLKRHHIANYITMSHIQKLALLLLAVNLLYIYFTFCEYLTIGYTQAGTEFSLYKNLMSGEYAFAFWSTIVGGLFVPAILLSLPWTRKHISGILIATILINIGMWMKRYLILVPTLDDPFMPSLAPKGHALIYSPTWVEWSITAGAIAGFCLLYILFSKVFPIISMWEMQQHASELRVTAPSSDNSGEVLS